MCSETAPLSKLSQLSTQFNKYNEAIKNYVPITKLDKARWLAGCLAKPMETIC